MDPQDQQLVIKILLLVGVAVATVILTRSSTGARHQAIRRVALILFGLAGAVVVIEPALLSRLARVVGVGRGTDLLLYALAVGFVWFLASYYGRQRALNRQITELTRALALSEARQQNPS